VTTFFLVVPAHFADLQISDGSFSLTDINLPALLYATHSKGGAALLAAKPNPQEVIDFVVH
ncbi:unnamed protein product, partial [Rotaria sordida]